MIYDCSSVEPYQMPDESWLADVFFLWRQVIMKYPCTNWDTDWVHQISAQSASWFVKNSYLNVTLPTWLSIDYQAILDMFLEFLSFFYANPCIQSCLGRASMIISTKIGWTDIYWVSGTISFPYLQYNYFLLLQARQAHSIYRTNIFILLSFPI